MEYSIQEVAKAAGTTSRTLRHYDSIGLVPPSRIGHNGYRYYDDRSLVRLQRVLLLRELGIGLDTIGQVLEAQNAQGVQASGQSPTEVEALILAKHLELLRQEQRRIGAQIGSVERTIAALTREARHGGEDSKNNEDNKINEGENLMAENMFDGFDHTQYRDEVEAKWGADAYAKSDSWWRGLGKQGQAEWRARLTALKSDWQAAAASGELPESQAAQGLAQRHVEWLRGTPGTPAWEVSQSAAATSGGLAGYVLGLAEMYVADERFAANYGGIEGVTFVRDALRVYVERELG